MGRMNCVGIISVLTVALLAAPPGRAADQAKGPTFDCAKATGAVENLICDDEGLAALDRKLDDVYKAAVAKAKNGLPQTLRAEQRGWVKGRDECWKAKGKENPVFLTESWKATSVSECVQGEYRLRISELQVRWQPRSPREGRLLRLRKQPGQRSGGYVLRHRSPDRAPRARRSERDRLAGSSRRWRQIRRAERHVLEQG